MKNLNATLVLLAAFGLSYAVPAHAPIPTEWVTEYIPMHPHGDEFGGIDFLTQRIDHLTALGKQFHPGMPVTTYQLPLTGQWLWAIRYEEDVLTPGLTPPPAYVTECLSPKPGPDWGCLNGGWLPPGHPALIGG